LSIDDQFKGDVSMNVNEHIGGIRCRAGFRY
jgi:hypothetical protein